MRVLLVDDHHLLLEGLENLLATHGFEVVGAVSDGFEAVAQVRLQRPDLVLMDVRMPRCDGLTATRMISAESPGTRVVMLTSSEEDDDLFEAIRCGASGYLLKSVTGDELVEALHGLDAGIPPLSRGLAARLLTELARTPRPASQASPSSTAQRPSPPATRTTAGITVRQEEVLRLVAAGLTYKEVAARLFMSERTVRYHMSEMIDRLHLEHRSQVLAYAGRMGLGTDPE